jgi:hypothetical protein
MPFATGHQFWGDFVFIKIRFHELVNFSVRNFVHGLDQISHPISIDIIAKPQLGFDFVPLGHGHVTHVIPKAGDFRALPVCPGTGGTDPNTNLFLNFILLPVTNNDFTIKSHATTDEAKFPVTVGSLVQIHEIHVDGRPGNLTVELGV